MLLSSYRKILICILFLTIAMQAWSYTVKGRLVSGNTPIPGINVGIYDKNGELAAQASTDAGGVFSLENIDLEKVVLKAEHAGYNTILIEIVTGDADTNLGTLQIERSTDLGEVTVTAKSRINTPGKTIVYASGTDRERAANPFNMLTILAYKVPLLHVRESERTITIDGEEPEILVNGVKRDLSYISSIKPDAIEKIELSTTPDVRFGRRYLNITTRRPQEGGWLMADVAGAVTTPRFFLNGVAEYTRGANDFMLHYNGGYRDGSKEYTDEEEHYAGTDRDITLKVEGMPSSTLDRYHNLNFYFTRTPSAKSMLAATGSLSLHDNDRKTYGRVTDYTESYERANKRGFRQIRPSVSLYYQLQASSRAILEVNAVGSYNDHQTHRDLYYSTGYSSRLDAKSHTWYFSGEALWRQQLSFASLNAGVSMSHNKASNKYVIDAATTRQGLSSTRVNAYASLGGSLLSFGYYLSAGMSYYKVDNGMVTPNVNASIQRNLGQNFSLSYNFQYNPQLPTVSDYNEVSTPVNDLMYHIGSTGLKAQHNITNQLQAYYQKNKFNISIQGSIMSRRHPLVTEYLYQDDPHAPLYGYFLEMSDNGRGFTSYGFDCNMGVSNLWNFLSLSASTGWGHNKVRLRDSFTVCSWYLGLNMGLYWKGWQLNLSTDDLVPAWSVWGGNAKIRRWPYTSLAIYKRLGRWNIHVSWSNMFSKYGGRYRTETFSNVVRRTSDYRMNDQGNMLEIGVRYDFTFGRLLSKKRRSVNLSGGGENGVSWDY